MASRVHSIARRRHFKKRRLIRRRVPLVIQPSVLDRVKNLAVLMVGSSMAMLCDSFGRTLASTAVKEIKKLVGLQ